MQADAAGRWQTLLAAWQLPDDLPSVRSDTPGSFPVARFAAIADLSVGLETPSRRVASEALPPGGSVLDVGCGAGAGSLPLAPPAGLLIGLDPQPSMLAAFAERARTRGVTLRTVEGSWETHLDEAGPADVVVAHHLAYGVVDLVGFARALTAVARHRVVLELSTDHPMGWARPAWRALHGIDAPDGPTSALAAEVLRDASIDLHVEEPSAPLPLPAETVDDQIAFLRSRLRVGPDRDDELRALVAAYPRPPERRVATLWWDVRARQRAVPAR